MKTGGNLQQLKENNVIMLLDDIRRSQPIPRVELAKRSGLSATSCTAITRVLCEKGIIRETGQGDSSGGRKPILLEIEPDFGYVIGIELLKSGIRYGFYNLKMEEKAAGTIGKELGGERLLPELRDCIYTMIDKSAISPGKILGMAIGVAGIVDAKRTELLSLRGFDTKDVGSIHQKIEDSFRFPVYIENYANLLVLAEKEQYYPDAGSMTYVIADEGIGAGTVLQNKIVNGCSGYAGEIGHISIDRKGPRCFCGNRGCVELYGSIPALMAWLQKEQERYPKTAAGIKPGECAEVVFAKLADAYAQGDLFARSALGEISDIYFHCVHNIINAYDPDVIVLGGELCGWGEALIDAVREKINRTVFNRKNSRVLAYSRLKNNRIALGAGFYAMEAFFRQPVL